MDSQEKFDDILDKIVAAYIKTIDGNPYYESLDKEAYQSQFENDKFLSFTTLTRDVEFEQGLLRDFYIASAGSTPNYRKPRNATNLCYHLPREVLDEIVDGSNAFTELKKKGYKITTFRMFKRNLQLCGILVRQNKV